MTNAEQILAKVGLTREDVQRLLANYRQPEPQVVKPRRPETYAESKVGSSIFNRRMELGNCTGRAAMIADMQYHGIAFG